jgi:hypothetical protein
MPEQTLGYRRAEAHDALGGRSAACGNAAQVRRASSFLPAEGTQR